MERVVFHIDMNSYFASVEQQANPFLRGKPIGVGGKPGTRGIIAAPSIEAKKRGVKTAMNAYEALARCPELEIVHGTPDAYEAVTNRFLRVFRRYTDAVEVFSIDEAFLDVTDWHGRHGGPEALALRIKADMRREVGERITCSVGIAPNKTLAKLASDLKKPDGLVRIRQDDALVYLAFAELTDICGIAGRTRRRLLDLGVRTLLDLRATPLSALTAAFGPVAGARLWMIGQGEDPSPVVDEEDAPKSFGNSYTLPHDETAPTLLRNTLFTLAEKACRRMRAEGFRCRRVDATVRYGDMSYAGDGGRLAELSDDPLEVVRLAWKKVLPLLARGPVRLLGVTLSELVYENGQQSLWPESERRHRLVHAMDDADAKWGVRTVHAAATLGVTLKRHVSGFKHGTTVERKRRPA